MKVIMMLLIIVCIVFLAIQIMQLLEIRKLKVGIYKNQKGEIVHFEYDNINEHYIVRYKEKNVIICGSHMLCKNYLRENKFKKMEEN